MKIQQQLLILIILLNFATFANALSELTNPISKYKLVENVLIEVKYDIKESYSSSDVIRAVTDFDIDSNNNTYLYYGYVPEIMKFDKSGKYLRKYSLSSIKNKQNYSFVLSGDNIYCTNNSNVIYKLNTTKDSISPINLPFKFKQNEYSILDDSIINNKDQVAVKLDDVKKDKTGEIKAWYKKRLRYIKKGVNNKSNYVVIDNKKILLPFPVPIRGGQTLGQDKKGYIYIKYWQEDESIHFVTPRGLERNGMRYYVAKYNKNLDLVDYFSPGNTTGTFNLKINNDGEIFLLTVESEKYHLKKWSDK